MGGEGTKGTILKKERSNGEAKRACREAGTSPGTLSRSSSSASSRAVSIHGLPKKQRAITLAGETGVMGVPRRSSLDPSKPRVAAREVLQGLSRVTADSDVLVVRKLLAKGADLLGPNVSESQRRLFVLNEGVDLSLAAVRLFAFDGACVYHGCAVITECFNLMGGSARVSETLLLNAFTSLSYALTVDNDASAFAALEMLTFLVHESPIGSGHMLSSDVAESDDGSEDPEDALIRSQNNRNDKADASTIANGRPEPRKRRDVWRQTATPGEDRPSCLSMLLPFDRGDANGSVQPAKKRWSSGQNKEQYQLPSRISEALRDAALTESLCSLIKKENNSPAIVEYSLGLLSNCIAVMPNLYAPASRRGSANKRNSIGGLRRASSIHKSSSERGNFESENPTGKHASGGSIEEDRGNRATANDKDAVQLMNDAVKTSIIALERFPRSLAVHERAICVLGAVARRSERECRELVDSRQVLLHVSNAVFRLPPDCRELQRSLSRILRAMANTDEDQAGNSKLHLAAAADLKCCALRLLNRGARIDATNGRDQTPVDIAQEHHSRGIRGILDRASQGR